MVVEELLTLVAVCAEEFLSICVAVAVAELREMTLSLCVVVEAMEVVEG